MQQKKQLSRGSIMFNVFYSMIPLFGFYIIEKYWGLQAGIIAAIVLSAIEIVFIYYKEKRIEPFALWSGILIVIMGVVSWQTESATLLLLKPAIFEGIFAFVFIFSSIIGKPFMQMMAMRQFGKENIHSFQMQYFKGLNWRIGIFFLIHTFLTVYAALFLSKDAWFLVKGVLFYVLFVVFLAFEMFYSRLKAKSYREKMQRDHAFHEYQKNMMEQIRKGGKSE